MIVYFTDSPVKSTDFIRSILEEYYGIRDPKLLKGKNGKPYLAENPLYFNLSHSGTITALAVGLQEVGLDIEVRTNRTHEAILRKLTAAERQEDFYKVWTAKEAYVKYRGETLASLLRNLAFERGALYINGERAPEFFTFFERENCVFCVCTKTTHTLEFKKVSPK